VGKPRTIGFVFIEGYADWEYGLLAASSVEWFGARAVPLSPGAGAVRSMAGFPLTTARGIAPAENGDLDAVALIGSDGWAEPGAPDLAPLVRSVRDRGGVIGAICGATLSFARAGFFEGIRHTSNGRDWIGHQLPDYPGAALYQDVPHAVSDQRIISAPGSAPGTFAHAFLSALYPERETELAEMKTIFASEHRSGS